MIVEERREWNNRVSESEERGMGRGREEKQSWSCRSRSSTHTQRRPPNSARKRRKLDFDVERAVAREGWWAGSRAEPGSKRCRGVDEGGRRGGGDKARHTILEEVKEGGRQR